MRTLFLENVLKRGRRRKIEQQTSYSTAAPQTKRSSLLKILDYLIIPR